MEKHADEQMKELFNECAEIIRSNFNADEFVPLENIPTFTPPQQNETPERQVGGSPQVGKVSSAELEKLKEEIER